MSGIPQLQSDKHGFVLTIVVLIIGSLVATVAVSTALSSLTNLQQANVLREGKAAEYVMESCLNEALLQMNRDENYESQTLQIGLATCDITITGIDNEREISIAANFDNKYYRIYTTTVTLDPFSVDSYAVE